MRKYFLLVTILVLLNADFCRGQLIPYFPIEISFNPFGITNEIPGDPGAYSSFSSLKTVLFKEIASTDKFSNSLGFDGVLDFYHDITKARDYTPIYTNATSRSMFFINDIFTLGIELIGNVVTQPGISKGTLFNLVNYRSRIRPFHYVVVTPNLLIQEAATIGFSRHSDSTEVEVATGTRTPLLKDYNLFKFEINAIYFTPFKTRFFLAPYAFYNQYMELPARSGDGTPNENNPKLREQGIGCALGARYSTQALGFSEIAFEFERNTDMIFDANSYTKLKVHVRSENQFVNDRIGYSIMAIYTAHISKNFSTGFGDDTNLTGELGQKELIIDIIPIYNFSKFLSLRPEYEFVYRDISGPNYRRSLFRIQMHIRY